MASWCCKYNVYSVCKKQVKKSRQNLRMVRSNIMKTTSTISFVTIQKSVYILVCNDSHV
jgi:amino acid permease